MAKFFKFCFDPWGRPLTFWFFSCLTFGLSLVWGNNTFGNFASALFGIGLVVVLISAIYQFINRKWWTGFLSLAIFGVTICAFMFYLYLITLVSMAFDERPDQWADNLTIPANIEINDPVVIGFEELRPDSITKRRVTKTDFQLYNTFQPGLYMYDFWTGNIESGTIYLKAFEITQDYALSTSRLPERSSVRISNPTDTVQRFGATSHFTIYEGDWGKPYAARFEVWFRPDSGGEERKLFSENYKIEGWMR